MPRGPMPDIGLLQGGPPGPRAAKTAPRSAPPERPAVRAHTAVVSEMDAPLAVAIAVPAPPAAQDAPAELARTPAQDPPPAPATSPANTPGFRMLAQPPPIRMSDLLWLALALLVIVGTGLGIRDPWPADEPRFAALARDMVRTGEWLFPRVGGDLYQDKPPLFFWLLALSYTVFGAVKAWFLIPSFLAAAGILYLVYDFGRRTVSREAGLGAALLVACTVQFAVATRGAQIDPTLCALMTFSMYAMLRQLLSGDGWRWYFLGGFAAGLGIFTKGVGFLPLLSLIPYFLLRGFGWKGLATIDAGRGGWRWWLAPLAMLLAVSLWFVPMLLAVAASDAPEYAAYRDEILFTQTMERYSAAWHHVKPWYYFLLEVIPALWMPWSILLFWLVPRFKAAFHDRNARIWLPLGWVLLVVLFFSLSPGKRGIYVLPALPALAMASMPLLQDLFARKGVVRAGWILALVFWMAALLALIASAFQVFGDQTAELFDSLPAEPMLITFLVICGLGMLVARTRAPIAAWPVTLGALCIAFSYLLAPHMNGQRSGGDFIRGVVAQVDRGEELGLVAYKEQFLLYLDRPTVNFGHRRWLEGPQESYDAAAWLNGGDRRVLLIPKARLDPEDSIGSCFVANVMPVGRSSSDDWFLVRAPASAECAAKGNAARAIAYPRHPPSPR
jgi:4-amino-4-deoxy-L-arabinose transferase-like glycosyltransferase